MNFSIVNWIMLAGAVVVTLVLIHALRSGVLITHNGPELHRDERPGAFWGVFVSYCLILACCLWGLIMW